MALVALSRHRVVPENPADGRLLSTTTPFSVPVPVPVVNVPVPDWEKFPKLCEMSLPKVEAPRTDSVEFKLAAPLSVTLPVPVEKLPVPD